MLLVRSTYKSLRVGKRKKKKNTTHTTGARAIRTAQRKERIENRFYGKSKKCWDHLEDRFYIRPVRNKYLIRTRDYEGDTARRMDE